MPPSIGAAGWDMFWWLLFFFGLSLAGTLYARGYAAKRDLYDHPGERRSHVVPTPRGGGIGIVLAGLVAMLVVAWVVPGQAGVMIAAGAGLLLVAAIGWLDDHRPLPAWPRLVVHAMTALLLAAIAWRASGQVPVALGTFLLAMVLVNIWNFMDGIDGIAATQAVVVACACALLAQGQLVYWLSLALAAACLGFLPMNLVRARIFLGDVGSGALGYLLALVMLLAALELGPARPGTWIVLLLPPSAFLLDATLTLGARMVRGERWWTPHVGHAYQRWADRSGRHWPVTLAYTLWAIAGSVLALWARDRPIAFIMSTGIAWYLGGGIPWLWLQSRRNKGLPGKRNG